MTIKWYDAKKNTPHLGEVYDGNFRKSEPCLIYGRDSSRLGYAFAVSTYVFNEEIRFGAWEQAYDYDEYYMSEIIAWTPLPEPPKMAEEKR